MFCPNCGTENEDNMQNCQTCGALLNSEETTPVEAPVEIPVEAPAEEMPVAMPKSLNLDEWVTYVKSLPQKIVLAGLSGFLAVLLLLLIFAGGGTYKSAVNSYFKAMEKGNAKKIVNLTIPKDIQKPYFEDIEDNLDKDKEEYLDYLSDTLEKIMDEVEDFEWEIRQAERLDKLDRLEDEMETMRISDLDDFRDLMEDRFEDYSKFNAKKISDAYAIKVKVRAEVDGEKESSTEVGIVYKYKGQWYLVEGFGL